VTRRRAARVRLIALLAITAVVLTWAVAAGARTVGHANASTGSIGSRCTAKDASALVRSPDDPGHWKWLAGTTWYVPKSGLPALRYDPKTGVSTPVRDQTVYNVASYTDGYFSGKTVIQTTAPGAPPSVVLRNLVASVTPQGAVMLTFIPPDPTGSLHTTVGIGQFVCRLGSWSMEMQMSTGSGATINHWAPMVNCRDGDRCNDRVPGTTMTLAEFESQIPTGE
jgi:hypothetical protein